MLTTVANAFSSLYSQVSGTPLQKIGSMNSTASSKEASSPPPLTRSNTASRLMKTLSKLNLCGNQQAGEGGDCAASAAEKGRTENGIEEGDVKNEPKMPKHFKASVLATVKEEVPNNQPSIVDVLKASELAAGNNIKQGLQGDAVSHKNEQTQDSLGQSDRLHENATGIGSCGFKVGRLELASSGLEGDTELQIPTDSTPEKEPCVPLANPSIMNLMLQQKDSFEMEEVSGKKPAYALCNSHLNIVC